MDRSDIPRKKDKQIISTLYHGKKQRSEIIEVVDMAASTVDSHLDDLVGEYGEVKRQKYADEVFYYLELESGARLDPIPPRPWGDSRYITKWLQDINRYFENVSSYESINHENVKSIREAVNKFELECAKYNVLESERNLELYFDFFDNLLNILAQRTTEHVMHGFIKQLLETARHLLDNWDVGMENFEFKKRLLDRKEDLFSAATTCFDPFSIILLDILKRIDEERAKDVVISLLTQSWNFSSEEDFLRDYILIVHEVFGLENNLHKFFERVETKRKKVDSNTAERIDEIINQIRVEYRDVEFSW